MMGLLLWSKIMIFCLLVIQRDIVERKMMRILIHNYSDAHYDTDNQMLFTGMKIRIKRHSGSYGQVNPING